MTTLFCNVTRKNSKRPEKGHSTHRLRHTFEISLAERRELNQQSLKFPKMRILIATDAWHPQVNGVVRTLTSLARSASALGAEIDFLTPDGFPSFGVPTYPGLRIALPNRREIARRIEAASPDAIHIATEGPIGWAGRAYCRSRKLAFTTSYTTRFPEYVS